MPKENVPVEQGSQSPDLKQEMLQLAQEKVRLLREINIAQGNIAKAIINDPSLSLYQQQRALNNLKEGRYDLLPDNIRNSPMMQKLHDSYNDLRKTQESADKCVTSLLNAANDSVNRAKARGKAAVEKTVSYFKGAITSLKNAFTKAADFLHTRNEQFRTGVKNVIEAYQDAGQKAQTMVREGVQRSMQYVVELGNAAEEQMQTVKNAAKETVKETASDLTAGAKATGAKLIDVANNVNVRINMRAKEQKAKSSIMRFSKADKKVNNLMNRESKNHNIANAARDLLYTLRTGDAPKAGQQKDYQMSKHLTDLIKARDEYLVDAKMSTMQYAMAAQHDVRSPGVFGQNRKISDLTSKIDKATVAAGVAEHFGNINPISEESR